MARRIVGCPHCNARAFDAQRGWRHVESTGRCWKCGKFFDDAIGMLLASTAFWLLYGSRDVAVSKVRKELETPIDVTPYELV